MITIISCNYHSKDFADILVRSIKKFSAKKYPVFIMDNSNEQELFNNDDYIVIKSKKNMGHGAGLDYLISNCVNTEFTLVMDIDAHILRRGYDLELLKIIESDSKIGLISPFRTASKPIHPAMMFFRTNDIKNRISMKPFNIMNDNIPIQMDVGQFIPMSINQIYLKKTILLKEGNPFYKDLFGSTWTLNGEKTFYHFGYGTRLYGKKEFGGILKSEQDEMKKKLFEQLNF